MASSSNSDPLDVLKQWRTTILNRFLVIAVLIALPSIVAIYLAIPTAPEYRTLALTFTLLEAVLIALAFLRNLPLTMRVAGALLLGYAAAIVNLVQTGLNGAGPQYLLVLPIVALIMIGKRAGVWTAAISARQAMHAIDSASDLSPAHRLEQVVAFTNHYVAETHADADMFATLVICLLSPDDDQIIYLNCGNEPAIVLRDGCAVTLLPPTGPCLGIIPEAAFTARSLTLQPGDTLLAYTDGVTDAMNAADESFGRERLLASLLASLKETPAAGPTRLVGEIAARLHEFTSPAEQFDDITLLALRRM